MAKNQNGFKEGMEVWEEELIRQAAAIRQMRKMEAGPTVLGKRILGSKSAYKRTCAATVANRDKRSLYGKPELPARTA